MRFVLAVVLIAFCVSGAHETVKIGKQTWLKRNMNVVRSIGNSWCYGDDERFCDEFGRLYDWEAAMNVCPMGFHLPSKEEWEELIEAVGGENDAGMHLKARDSYGFEALPGGELRAGKYFNYAVYYGRWWSASEVDIDDFSYAYSLDMGYSYDEIYLNANEKSYGFSVRCVMD